MKTTFITMTFSLLGLLFFFSPSAHAKALCENVFNDVREFTEREALIADPALKVRYRHVEIDKREFFVSDVMGKTDDILLSFAPFGHAYIVKDTTRLDGSVLSRTLVNNHMAELDAGIVIRIKRDGLSSDFLKEYKKAWGITCAKTACSALSKVDLFAGPEAKQYFTPEALLTTILQKGIYDRSGNAVPFDVYYIGKFDLPVTLRRLTESSATIKKDQVTKAAVIATGVTTITATLLYLFSLEDDTEKSPAGSAP
ncbi:hypothetical protein ACLVWU_03360 [Bdellovibrio sp. HCB290]|uniref:hypothetical protein n=1 Tax=Bdellovibrio sp. HCB290 TaxID=3394356 RepID=UPI0039B54270